MSDFIKRLAGTVVNNVLYSTALCACVSQSDPDYWNGEKLGYIALFWLGAMMPIKMG